MVGLKFEAALTESVMRLFAGEQSGVGSWQKWFWEGRLDTLKARRALHLLVSLLNLMICCCCFLQLRAMRYRMRTSGAAGRCCRCSLLGHPASQSLLAVSAVSRHSRPETS